LLHDPDVRYWKVKAKMELGSFKECSDLGRGSVDPRIISMVSLCTKRQ